MEQSNIFGYILSVLERRLAAYFGDDKNLHLDEKEISNINAEKEVYSEGVLSCYSLDSFEKRKDFDVIDFNETKTVRKFGKVKPIIEKDCENPNKTPIDSLEANNEYCDMV
jgi:hypothetical protein